MPDETVGTDVPSSPTPAAGGDASPSLAPTSGAQGAIAQPTGSGSTAAPPFTVPDTDDDLRGRETQPYVQGIMELRKGFRDLNGRYQTLEQEYNPVKEQLDRIGGVETAVAAYELATKLFAPVNDQYGNQMIDQQTGLPVTTSQAFVQHVAQNNWDTALDMTENLLMLPTASGEPLAFEVLRRGFGLDPAKLDLYRAIQSPAEAAQRGLLDVTPQELRGIPEKYHKTYSRLGPAEREAIQDYNLEPATRLQMMESFRRQHEMEDYINSQREIIQQEQARREQEYQYQIENLGEDHAVSLWSTHENALKEELGKVQWSADPQESEMIASMIEHSVVHHVMNDAKVAPLRQQCYDLIKQAVRLEAAGNKLQANQARIRAAQLGQQVAGLARIYMTQRVAALQGRGVAPTNGAAPRPVINSAGQNGPGGHQGGWQIPPGIKFGSEEYFNAAEAHRGGR